MDKLEEMDKFLEKYNLIILNQEEIEVIRPFISTKIKTVIKKIFQQTKVQGKMVSQVKSTKVYRIANTYPAQTLPENCRGRKSPKLLL